MLKEFGRYVTFLGSLLVRRESFRTYYHLIIEECILIGVNSVVLVALVSFFMGAVTTVQTAANLVSSFVPKFVISQVVREMTMLELAPTVIALIYAGKVGSSMAGGLGSMRISEQIDALEVMGINASSYLVLPKIIASITMYPLLVVLAVACSLFGGYLIGTTAGIVTPTEFIYGVRYNFNPFYVVVVMVKASVFSFLVASISCFKGFYTSGGALEVGISSTQEIGRAHV